MSRVRFDDAAVHLKLQISWLCLSCCRWSWGLEVIFSFKQRRRLEDVSGCLLDLVYLRKYSLSWYERVCSFLVDSAELCAFLCDLLQKDDGDVFLGEG